jgi:hypothetical protein
MLPTSVILAVVLVWAVKSHARPGVIAAVGIGFGVAVAAGRFGGLVESVNGAVGDIGNDLLKAISEWFESKRGGGPTTPAAGLIVATARYNLNLLGFGR